MNAERREAQKDLDEKRKKTEQRIQGKGKGRGRGRGRGRGKNADQGPEEREPGKCADEAADELAEEGLQDLRGRRANGEDIDEAQLCFEHQHRISANCRHVQTMFARRNRKAFWTLMKA